MPTGRFLPALAVSLGLVSPALVSPAMAATDLRGGGFLTDFSDCGPGGWTGTERIFVRYRPAGFPENHPTLSRITFFFGGGVINYSFDFQPEAYPEIGEWFAVDASMIFASPFTADNVQMRVVEASPIDQLVAGATTVFVAFELTNFDGTPGCNARGRIALALQQ